MTTDIDSHKDSFIFNRCYVMFLCHDYLMLPNKVLPSFVLPTHSLPTYIFKLYQTSMCWIFPMSECKIPNCISVSAGKAFWGRHRGWLTKHYFCRHLLTIHNDSQTLLCKGLVTMMWFISYFTLFHFPPKILQPELFPVEVQAVSQSEQPCLDIERNSEFGKVRNIPKSKACFKTEQQRSRSTLTLIQVQMSLRSTSLKQKL